METEVLIIGAGPTGLMLANQLARRHVHVTIIDQHAGPSIQTKALGVQARTLEIYSRLGIAERAVELGRRAGGATIWSSGKRAARVPLGDIGADLSPYPFLLILGQDDNEALLGNALGERGVHVQWNSRLVDLTQHADGVSARIARQDGTVEEIAAKWVAGCDGPHSTVRETCGIPFSGAPYPHMFYVADTRATGSMAPDELNIYLWRGGFHLFFPLRGQDHWRVVGILPAELRSRVGLEFDDVSPYIRREVGGAVDKDPGDADAAARLTFQDCGWFSTYQVHHRRAGRFRDRRCFLLGDAAHIHSPVGAQGMNTGLQDAYNLAWKLALVLSGSAGEGLLDSYETERIPVAERLLRTTDQAFSFLISERWLAEAFRTRVFQGLVAMAMRRERSRKLAFRTISQTGIRYRSSPLSRMQAGLSVADDAPRAGDRFPWLRLRMVSDGPVEDLFATRDDTRFNLMLFGQPAPAPAHCFPGHAGGLMTTHVIPDDPVNDQALARAGIPRPSFYLLRPDGHIGLAGSVLDPAALNDYLTGPLQLRASAAADAPSIAGALSSGQ